MDKFTSNMPQRVLVSLEKREMLHNLNDCEASELSREQAEFIVVEVARQIDRLSLKKLTLASKQPTLQTKINYLENELYRRSMEENITTDELTKIHEALVWSENEKAQTQIKEANSLTSLFNQLINAGFLVIGIATVVSLIALKPCQHSQTPFCNLARIIPEFVQNIFKEPTPNPRPKVLPKDLP